MHNEHSFIPGEGGGAIPLHILKEMSAKLTTHMYM